MVKFEPYVLISVVEVILISVVEVILISVVEVIPLPVAITDTRTVEKIPESFQSMKSKT